MKTRIITMALAIAMLITLCACTTTPSLDAENRIPDDFTNGYEKADFDAMNSPASENGLNNTLVYIYCRVDKIETQDDTFFAHVTDSDNHKWMIILNLSTKSSIDTYQELMGEEMMLCGFYQGFSDSFNKPFIIMSKLCLPDSGEIIPGWMYDVAEFYLDSLE